MKFENPRMGTVAESKNGAEVETQDGRGECSFDSNRMFLEWRWFEFMYNRHNDVQRLLVDVVAVKHRLARKV